MKALINGNIEFSIEKFRESHRVVEGTIIRQELVFETRNTDVNDILQKFSDIQSLAVYDDSDNQLLDLSNYKNLERIDRFYDVERQALISMAVLTHATTA